MHNQSYLLFDISPLDPAYHWITGSQENHAHLTKLYMALAQEGLCMIAPAVQDFDRKLRAIFCRRGAINGFH